MFEKIGLFFSNLFNKIVSVAGQYLARGVFILCAVLGVFGFYYTVRLLISTLNGDMHYLCKLFLSLVIVGFLVVLIVLGIPYVKTLIDTLNSL